MNTLVLIAGSGFFNTDAITASRTETHRTGAEFKHYCRTDEGINSAVQSLERQSRCVREKGSYKLWKTRKEATTP